MICSECGSKIAAPVRAVPCRVCSALNAPDAFRCAACGAVMARQCPNCYTINPPGATTCRSCGHSLDTLSTLFTRNQKGVQARRDWMKRSRDADAAIMQELRSQLEEEEMRWRRSGQSPARRQRRYQLRFLVAIVVIVGILILLGLGLMWLLATVTSFV
jgi:ribosomal protein L40E